MAQTLKFGNGTWATKKGSTLAFNDQEGNYKPLPFTTTRATGATRVNKEGLIEVVEGDRPRIDYTDTSDGVLLLEKAATNLIPYSEDFSNAAWTKNAGTTITNNYAISPDGSLNASRYLGTGTSGLGDKFTLSVTDYTISIWVKSNNGVNQFCRLIGDSSNVSSDLLITTEWNRISYTFTGSGLSNKTNGIFRDSNDNDIDILIYGAMLEQNSVASSYIPTQGSAVTRVADTASGSGNSEVFNDSEGVLFADISALVNENVLRKIQVNDNTSNNNITVDYYSSSNSIRANLWNGSSQYSYIYTLTDVTLSTKVAFLYKSSEFKFYVNGIKVNESSSGSTFSSGTLKTLDLSTSSGSFPFYGKTKELGYYDEILTDLELETLTSYRSLNELVTELNLNTL